MNKLITLLLVLITGQYGFCQEYHADFLKHFNTGNTKKQLKVLKKWEAESPNDAALFTSYFNYHVKQAQRVEFIKETYDPETYFDYILRFNDNRDPETVLDNIKFDLDELKKGFNKIDEGIKLFPNRLDMRFGKIFVLGQVADWNAFTREIIKAIEHSAKNDNKWTWTNGTDSLGDQESFLLAIRNYQIGLYDVGNDALIDNMIEISNALDTHYPEYVDNLITLSTCYLLKKDYEKGIDALLKAESINQNDYVILGKIAEAYKLKGDYMQAIEYYKKTYVLGNERAIAYAREQVKLLSDKAFNIEVD